jgi:predicted ATPase/class 3 adenylate cyclase
VSSDLLPTGTVTFLFTDVEGSTRLWEEHPDEMGPALARHDEIVESLARSNDGVVVRPRGEGDSRFAVFARASDAVAAAFQIQLALRKEPFSVPVVVRIAVHTGEADLRAGDYYGPAVNRAARLRAIAHGGQTLISMSTEELARDALPEGVHLEPLGAFRLKDLSRIENVFQLCHPDLPSSFPALRSLDVAQTNLPIQLTSFVGREAEVASVREQVEGSRLVTLNGAGGCGKTRLALQAAAEMLEAFPDGVWFADLAPITDPGKVIAVIAAAVGAREEAGRDLLDITAATIGDLRMLVLVDNCEHLLDAAARIASELLQRCPGLSVLATAREPLGIAGERTWRVPSLSLPDPDGDPTLESLNDSEAARLFLTRARAVTPDLRLDAEDLAAIAQICTRLDGIALALELAAARTDVLTCAQIAERLDDRFRLLTGGSRTALERQQTLRAALDWSYGLLSETARTLFARLSVFSGGFTLEAAEAICAGGAVREEDILDLVSDLVRKSLVVPERRPGRAPRYRLLETMRQYARERLLASDDAVHIRDRHAAWFADLGDASHDAVWLRDQLRWLDQLGDEHDNIRSALDWLVGGSTDHDAALRLAGGMMSFWLVRGFWSEGLGWIDRALALSGGDPTARVRALTGKTRLLFTEQRGHEARTAAAEALEAAERLGDRDLIVRARLMYGVTSIMVGDRADAVMRMREVLPLAEENGDVISQALAWNGLGISAGSLDDALDCFGRVLEIAREHGMLRIEAMVEGNIAFTLRSSGEVALALEHVENSLRIAREIGDRQIIGLAITNLRVIAFLRGDVGGSRSFEQELRQILAEVGGISARTWSAFTSAQEASAEGDVVRAHALFAEASDVARANDLRTPAVWAAFFAGIHALAIDPADAAARLQWARDTQVGNDPDDVAAIEMMMGWLDIDQGNLARARERILAGIDMTRRFRSKLDIANGLDEAGAIALGIDDLDAAAVFFGASDALRASLGVVVMTPLRPRIAGYHERARTSAGFAEAWARGAGMDWGSALEELQSWLKAADLRDGS